MSCPDNSYSIRMRRLKQKQDALYANNTIGSQLTRPFNYNISPTGSMGNQFMLGTVAGSKNEVNTSPFGHVNNDIACTCAAAVEEVAGPIQTVGPNIVLMVPGSVYGFAKYDATRSCIFKVDTSVSPPVISYQNVNTTLALPLNFTPYLMEKGATYLYIAGYSASGSKATTYLIVINPATGAITKQFTYTGQTILGINEISTNLYITSVAVDISDPLSPSITSYVNIYDITNINTTPPTIRTFTNAVIRGKILSVGSNYYALIYYILPNPPPTIKYNIYVFIWTDSTLPSNFTSPTIKQLISDCTTNLNLFTDLTILINSPTTINIITISSINYLVFADCINNIASFYQGLYFFGYNITGDAAITPVRLDTGTPLNTPYVTNLVRCGNYFYVAAGTNTNRIYGINISGIPFTAAITPSDTTQYSAANNRFTTDNTSLFRFEFNGAAYRLARYVADNDLSGSPATTYPLEIYNSGIFGNVVYDPLNNTSIYLNTTNGSITQLNSTALTTIGSVSLDVIPI